MANFASSCRRDRVQTSPDCRCFCVVHGQRASKAGEYLPFAVVHPVDLLLENRSIEIFLRALINSMSGEFCISYARKSFVELDPDLLLS